MKKKGLKIVLATGAVCLLAACDSKMCYCYNYTSTGVRESSELIDSEKSCQSLNRGNVGEFGSRGCVESNERLDIGEIAWK